MNKKLLTWGAVILGIIFIVLAIMYWVIPAGSLPHFFPGFISGSLQIHFKHGLASLVLAILLFVYAWFISGPNPTAV